MPRRVSKAVGSRRNYGEVRRWLMRGREALPGKSGSFGGESSERNLRQECWQRASIELPGHDRNQPRREATREVRGDRVAC